MCHTVECHQMTWKVAHPFECTPHLMPWWWLLQGPSCTNVDLACGVVGVTEGTGPAARKNTKTTQEALDWVMESTSHDEQVFKVSQSDLARYMHAIYGRYIYTAVQHVEINSSWHITACRCSWTATLACPGPWYVTSPPLSVLNTCIPKSCASVSTLSSVLPVPSV